MTINLNMLKFCFFTNHSSLKLIARLYQQSSQDTYFFRSIDIKKITFLGDFSPFLRLFLSNFDRFLQQQADGFIKV